MSLSPQIAIINFFLNHFFGKIIGIAADALDWLYSLPSILNAAAVEVAFW